MKLLHLVLVVAALLAGAGQAQAATVAVLWPPNPSADAAQALTLLRGELLSVGLEVMVLPKTDAHAQTPAPAWLDALAAQGTSAVIDPIGADTLDAVDVWVAKTNPPRFEVTHVAFDPDAPRQPEILALRAVEALRAGLLQMDWAARKRRGAAVEEPAASPPAAVSQPSAPHERVGLEIGAATLMSLDGLGPALMPTVGVGWTARPWLLVQASAAGLGSRPTVTNAAGSARVAQQYATLGGSYRFRSSQTLWPFIGLSGGALHTSVEGRTGLGTTGHNLGRWSALLDVSLGTGLRLYGRVYMTLAAHLQLVEPYVAVDIVDSVGATSGHPNLLLTLTLGAWL